tara:strand:- start:332 stop:562 length:231 start_codon:yes stop_codon:yes gene_type:complete
VKKFCAAAALVLFSSCEGISVADAYVEADRLTYEAIAPHYQQYLEADGEITDANRKARIRLLTTWKMRIDANTKAK